MVKERDNKIYSYLFVFEIDGSCNFVKFYIIPLGVGLFWYFWDITFQLND